MRTSMLLLAIGLLAATPSTGFSQDTETDESFLFVELAQTAELADGMLTLSGIDQTVHVFADRPYRDVGEAAVDAVVGAWATGLNSFVDDPPNAALTGTMDGAQVAFVVVLGTPQLEASQLRFPVEVIAGEDTAKLEGAALMIDNFAFGCCIIPCDTGWCHN
jgi:hypothetical protein